MKCKVTRLGAGYGCRVINGGGEVIVEGHAPAKAYIGAVCRDLLRTLDKLGGNAFTSAARHRKYKPGNAVTSTKHFWGGK